VKAQVVKGLDPAEPFADAMARIVRVRLAEACAFAPAVLDEDEVEALHDLRIAAKRLRYILELSASCFGSGAAGAAKQARALQDLIGEIHDCDVMLPRVLAHEATLRAEDAAAVARLAGHATDVSPELVAAAPNADAYAGLGLLAVHLAARRRHLYARFRALWLELERERAGERLLAALDERPLGAGARDLATAADADTIPAGEHPD